MNRKDRNIYSKLNNLIKKELLKNILLYDKIASGKLYNSIDVQTIEDKLGIYLKVKSLHYLKYVNYGRKPGKFPPISSIKRWVEIKKIDKKFKQNVNNTAYIIAKSIAKKGVKPTYIIEKTINDLQKNKEFLNILDLLSKEKVMIYIEELFNNFQ